MFLIKRYSTKPSLAVPLDVEPCHFLLPLPDIVSPAWVCEAGRDQRGRSQNSMQSSMSSGRIPGETKGLKKSSSAKKRYFLLCIEFRGYKMRSYHMHKVVFCIHLLFIHEMWPWKRSLHFQLLLFWYQFEPNLRKSGTLLQPFNI